MSTFSMYAELCKARLSSLVVMTTGAGFLMAGAPDSWLACAAATIGTSLAAGAAGTFNQVWETSNDMAMKRTQRRPLPSGRISKPKALAFGAGLTASSAAVLLAGTNPVTAALGIGNIVLYALIYTPLKTRSELNTAVGALVGAIPPVMGWVAATGSSVLAPEPVLLALLLFWWQFPHFYCLAFTHRKDYARGGFAMVPVVDGGDGKRTAWYALRSAVALTTLPVAAAALGVVNPMFAVEGIVLNGYFLALCYRFWRDPTDATARPVFRTSLWYLPLLLGLMVFHSVHWNNAKPEEEPAGAAAGALALAAAGSAASSLEDSSTLEPPPSAEVGRGAPEAVLAHPPHAASSHPHHHHHHVVNYHHGDAPLPSRALQAVVATAKDAGRALCLHESKLMKDGEGVHAVHEGNSSGGSGGDGGAVESSTAGAVATGVMKALCPVPSAGNGASAAVAAHQGDSSHAPAPATTGCPITAAKALVGVHTRVAADAAAHALPAAAAAAVPGAAKGVAGAPIR